MTDYVEKPTEGFQTPYQFLLDLVGDRILAKIDTESINPESLYDRWQDITEFGADIEVPEANTDANGNPYWKTFISWDEREIGKIPVRFYTFTLAEYLKSVLADSAFQLYPLGKTLTQEGFYYSEGTNEIFLVIKANYKFCNGILVSGIEFKTSTFLIADSGQSLYVDSPVVTGEMQIIYIN